MIRCHWTSLFLSEAGMRMLLCITVLWLVQMSMLCQPHPPPPPSPSTIPSATGEVPNVGLRRKSPRHIQTAAQSPHNSSFICEQKVALESFLMLSRTHSCHCHVVLCLKVENPIPDLPLAICFALMDHFRASIFPNNQPCKWKTTQMCF